MMKKIPKIRSFKPMKFLLDMITRYDRQVIRWITKILTRWAIVKQRTSLDKGGGGRLNIPGSLLYPEIFHVSLVLYHQQNFLSFATSSANSLYLATWPAKFLSSVTWPAKFLVLCHLSRKILLRNSSWSLKTTIPNKTIQSSASRTSYEIIVIYCWK